MSSSSSSTMPDAYTEQELWEVDYVNEEHIQAFAHALSLSDNTLLENDVLSPSSPRSPPIPIDPPDSSIGRVGSGKLGHPPERWKYGPDNGAMAGGDATASERVEKLTATSDFAPIHQRVSRRRTRSSNQGITYHLIRWPLLGFIFLIISIEFGAYVFTRQVVNVFEWLVAWRGHKAKLRSELRRAKTYDEWVTAARKLDAYLGFDEWKETEDDSYFDWVLVKRVRRTLTKLRAAKDSRGLMDALAVCVRSNFAGTESVKMYSETFIGTKRMVEAHINEVARCLDFVRTATDVSLEEKRGFFRAINKNYGSSALCLSGGASFGYYHFGVIKAFLDADLLPRVVTGTSAGGLVAALLCTRTDAELKQLLIPRLADKITACEDSFAVWSKRWLQTGARFSTLEWARKSMFFTYGSLTFKEAYERTGRALNVSVVPSDRHSPTILLNHLTAPNCLIWSAILASAAVPGILNPVVLMAKDRDGHIKPHNLGGSRFKDGSLREDIPLGSLHTQFNCNFSIVSQTNPHIHLFFFAPKGSVGRPVAHRKGKGWRGGFILSALESYIKLDLSKHFKVIRDLDLMPQLLQSDWSGVFLQRFSGDLTLTPRSTISDWFRILSDPDRKQLAKMMSGAEKVTWPALHMVRNRMTIERAILRGRTEVRTALQRDRPTNDSAHVVSGPTTSNALDLQVPIESDADAGFARRSRKAIRTGLPYPAAADMLGRDAARRRRGRRPDGTATPPDVVSPPSGGRISPSATTSGQRGYTSALGETFRHVRTSSLTAFGQNFSPFRSIRGIPPTERERDGANDSRSTHPRRSGSAIARWFGGAGDDSSSEEEGDGDIPGAGGAGGEGGASSGPSGDEQEPSSRFALSEEPDAVVVDEDELSESGGEVGGEDGVVPIPGGERVSQSQIDASTTAGSSRADQEDRRHGAGYSPPGQDGQQ